MKVLVETTVDQNFAGRGTSRGGGSIKLTVKLVTDRTVTVPRGTQGALKERVAVQAEELREAIVAAQGEVHGAPRQQSFEKILDGQEGIRVVVGAVVTCFVATRDLNALLDSILSPLQRLPSALKLTGQKQV